jgi:hypothetical protein
MVPVVDAVELAAYADDYEKSGGDQDLKTWEKRSTR